MHDLFLKEAEKLCSTVIHGKLIRKNASGVNCWSFLRSKQQNADLMVFFHGTGNDRFFMMYDLFLSWLRQGKSILTFDLDGHGADSSTVFDEFSILSCFSDSMEFIQEQIHHKEIHLVGNSLGGLLIAHGALLHKYPISSIILIGVPSIISIDWKAMRNEISSPWEESYKSFRKRWGLRNALPAIGPFNRSRFPIRFSVPKDSMLYVDQVSRLSRRINLDSIISKIVPILAIFGSKDQIAPLAQYWELSSPMSEIHLVEGNHFPPHLVGSEGENSRLD